MCDCHEKIKDYFWREKKGFDVEIAGVIPLDSRHGNFNVSINATFCPFCGKKYEKGQEKRTGTKGSITS